MYRYYLFIKGFFLELKINENKKENNLPNISFLYHEDEELTICDNTYKKHLCSHAQTCKFKKNKENIYYCIHTKTCEFFCQKYTSNYKLTTQEYNIHYEEAILAKKQKRHRN